LELHINEKIGGISWNRKEVFFKPFKSYKIIVRDFGDLGGYIGDFGDFGDLEGIIKVITG
jgi:hypothetical protein